MFERSHVRHLRHRRPPPGGHLAQAKVGQVQVHEGRVCAERVAERRHRGGTVHTVPAHVQPLETDVVAKQVAHCHHPRLRH
eukprot:6270654-Pyramimonas_sp.AAC.2